MGRSPCCEKAHTNKGAWTKEEDQRLVAYIKAHQWRRQKKKLAGATSNDRPNQNGKHTNSHIQILQLRKFYAKFIDVVSNLKIKNTN
jgi:hypothetical protein